MDCTRRGFVAIGGAAAGAAGTALAGTTAALADETEADYRPITSELPIPDEEPPAQTGYEVDVLVAGGGYAGLNAAAAAADAGLSVLLIEKGHPGYGGLSSWGGGSAHFEDYNDEAKICKLMMQANEYLANLNWVKVWCEDSPAFWDRMTEWGINQQYTGINDTEYYVDGLFDGSDGHNDMRGYFQSGEVAPLERHPYMQRILDDKGVPYLDHTMLYDVLESEGRVVGAVAFHFQSGTVITIKAKAVVLGTGGGSIRPNGFPTGGNTFDGLAIGYRHGLPIAGMEFENYELAWGVKPGLPLSVMAGSQYVKALSSENPGVTPETDDDGLWGTGFTQRVNFDPVVNGLATPDPTRGSWALPGAAPGMSLHMVGGIFNGWDDVWGQTALPGLYVAGDGTYASAISGACYAGITGLTTSGCSIQGFRAGTAAAEYVAGVEHIDLPQDQIDDAVETIMAPLACEKGFHPVFVTQQLLNAMAVPTVLYMKDEASLQAALTQVEHIRDFYLPKLRADSTHDQRLCIELANKVLACEIKLRLSLERKESRGMHYRTDFPFRSDECIGMYTVTKTDEDSMAIAFVEVPEEWKGDLSAPYEERYQGYHFPGEAEALGIEFPEQAEGPGGVGGFVGKGSGGGAGGNGGGAGGNGGGEGGQEGPGGDQADDADEGEKKAE